MKEKERKVNQKTFKVRRQRVLVRLIKESSMIGLLYKPGTAVNVEPYAEVVSISDGITDLKVGDKVLCNFSNSSISLFDEAYTMVNDYDVLAVLSDDICSEITNKNISESTKDKLLN